MPQKLATYSQEAIQAVRVAYPQITDDATAMDKLAELAQVTALELQAKANGNWPEIEYIHRELLQNPGKIKKVKKALQED